MKSVKEAAYKLVEKADSYMNVISGLGTSKYGTRHGVQVMPERFSQAEIEQIYRVDDVARRYVDKLPKACFRPGFQFKVEGDKDETVAKWLQSEFDRLKIQEKFINANIEARKHGGAVLLLGVTDGSEFTSEPLQLGSLKSVDWMQYLHRWDVSGFGLIRDLQSENYLHPQTYHVHGTSSVGQEFHYSRLIRFDGELLGRYEFERNNYWHDTVIQNIWPHLVNYQEALNATQHLTKEQSMTVMKIANLVSQVAIEGGQKLLQRIELINQSKSIARTTIIDKEHEDISRVEASVQNLAPILDKFESRLVSAVGWPHNIILGDGAKGGLGSNGELELAGWFEIIDEYQETYIKPRLYRIIDLLLKQDQSPTKGFVPPYEVVFNPSYQKTPEQLATLYGQLATADANYINLGVLTPEDVRKRFKPKGFEAELVLEQEHEEQVQSDLETELMQQFEAAFRNDSVFSYPGIDFTPPQEAVSGAKQTIDKLVAQGAYEKIPSMIIQLGNGKALAPTDIMRAHRLFTHPDVQARAELYTLLGGEPVREWVSQLCEKMKAHETIGA